MADVLITELEELSTVAATDFFVFDNELETHKIAALDLAKALKALVPGIPTGAWNYWELAVAPSGWVIGGSGKTIGNAASNGTSRANADTWDLFNWTWTNFNNTIRPIYDSAGIASTRGPDAATDFAANKAIQITHFDDRFVKAKDPGTTLNATGGNDTHEHTVDPHTHTGPSHTHTGPSHTHTAPAHTHARGTLVALIGQVNNEKNVYYNSSGSLLGSSSHRFNPSAGVHEASIKSMDSNTDIAGSTASDGNDPTGSGGTGATGSGGTGATGSASPDTDAVNHEPPFIVQNIIVKL